MPAKLPRLLDSLSMQQGPSLPAPKFWGQDRSSPPPSQPCSRDRWEAGTQGVRLCFLRVSMENVGFKIWQTRLPMPAPYTLDCNFSQSRFLICKVEIIIARTSQKLCAHGMRCRGKTLTQGSGSTKRGPILVPSPPDGCCTHSAHCQGPLVLQTLPTVHSIPRDLCPG